MNSTIFMATTPLRPGDETDPVDEPDPMQEPLTPGEGDDPAHPPFSPDREPDIPQDPESERVVQPEPVGP